MLVFPAHTFHNSEQYWSRPTEFLPQRFLPEGQEKLGPTTANAHMPFGLGARMCPVSKVTLFALSHNALALRDLPHAAGLVCVRYPGVLEQQNKW